MTNNSSSTNTLGHSSRSLHNLSSLTQQYLQQLIRPYSSGTVPWSRIKQLMNQLNYPTIIDSNGKNNGHAHNRDYDVQRSIVLMNAMKHILMATFGSVNGIRDNRMYTWMGMVWAYHMHTLITNIQNKIQTILNMKQNQNNAQMSKQMICAICNGLLLCQILISLIQNSSKGNMSNRIIYPQMYRFIQVALQCVTHLNIQFTIKNELQIPIKTTQIIKKLVQNRQQEQLEKQSNKKSKQNKITKKKQIGIADISCEVVAKIVQLINRSFQLCKKNIIMSLTAVKVNINGTLKSIIKYDQPSQNGQITINIQNTQSNPTLTTIILNYLKQFQQSGDNLNTVQQQIDEENKIIEVKELTPRLIQDQPNFQLKKLRTKKKKLIKRIESDARTAKLNKLQQQRVLQDVRAERVNKKQKKQIFVMQKQTEEAKKEHKKTKRVKQIQKQGKNRGKGNKFEAIAKSKKIKK